nr:hypothetical protein [bacterium]
MTKQARLALASGSLSAAIAFALNLLVLVVIQPLARQGVTPYWG